MSQISKCAVRYSFQYSFHYILYFNLHYSYIFILLSFQPFLLLPLHTKAVMCSSSCRDNDSPGTLQFIISVTTPVSFSFSPGHSYRYTLERDEPESITMPYWREKERKIHVIGSHFILLRLIALLTLIDKISKSPKSS